ncbi:nuclear factor interleukin-3-regulated protein [Betta splendens]|uniref:Nuclear factor interleukin-3-regulated protein n=1 Tax=Betta splendens TaxID=158456 RepID=A0A6P7M5A9_BETSP|nr:nuclear factor interleukin-3-regulated protein [Betta splendens]
MSNPSSPAGAESSSAESSGYKDSDPERGFLLPVTRSSLLARRLLGLRACSSHMSPTRRRKREMIPADKKDSSYWDKRRKNNEAAKRSREKRRLNDLMLESQLLALSEENAQLRARVLSLQYHSSLSAEKSKVAACAASTLPSPRPTHGPALLHAGLWGSSRSIPASALARRQRETAGSPLETKIPGFSSLRGAGGFHPLSPQTGGRQQSWPLSGPHAPPPQTAMAGRKSAEAEMDAQRQVSSSDDFPTSSNQFSSPLSSIRGILSAPDALPHPPHLPYQPQNWLVPRVNPSAVYNNLLLPWRSSYLPPPAVYPCLPLCIQDRQAQGLGTEADTLRGEKSRFGDAPVGMSQLSPERR